MYKTSTRFIKDQIPGITMRQLLLLYERELQEQGMDSTSVDNASVGFINGAVNWEFNTFYNNLTFFTKERSGSPMKERNTWWIYGATPPVLLPCPLLLR